MKINILGFGVMGKQIAGLLVHLGYQVSVWNRSFPPESVAYFERILRIIKRKVPGDAKEGNIEFITALNLVRPHMTIETLVESLDVKKEIIAGLAFDLASVEVFSNTSSIQPGLIHHGVKGLHFFNPVHGLKLAELACKKESLGTDGSRLIELLGIAGYEIVQTSANPGYIGNYMLFHEISAALKLVDVHGYGTREIDRVMGHLGRTTSVFDVIDLIGVDVTLRILESLHSSDSAFYPSPLLRTAVQNGILGAKNTTSIRNLIDK